MSLQEEIDRKAKDIQTDSYPMSIGELSSMYRDEELDIHPDFQRFFRWTIDQKSKLIESLLLGIPIPSIFVAQREDGVWDVVDGLQRLSTIFHFMGILRDEDGALLEPLRLKKTKFLPSLEGKLWERKDGLEENDAQEGEEEFKDYFTAPLRLQVKRSKLQIQIVLKHSDGDAKYELFQRLNTGGSALSSQEVRNCMLVMLDKDIYLWLVNLAKDEHFLSCTSLSDRQISERQDMELVLRFILYRHKIRHDDVARASDLNELMTEELVKLCEEKWLNFENEEKIFRKTFHLLNLALEDNVFRKFSEEKGRHFGPFSISAFECIVPALSKSIDRYELDEESVKNIRDIIKGMWTNPIFISNSGAGLRAPNRIPHLFPLGERLFGLE